MPDNVSPDVSGGKETFIVEVQYRQNATWQGTLTWVGQKKSLCFRSMLEMIRLMDSAMSGEADENTEKSGKTGSMPAKHI